MSAVPSQLLIHTDGGSRGNPGPAAVGVFIITPDQQVVHEFGECIGVGTNNEAEYQAILLSLNWLKQQDLSALKQVTWKLDSKLVVEQLLKHWKIKEPRMLVLAQKCWVLLAELPGTWNIVHIPRAENAAADALVNQALDAAAL